MSFKVTSHTSRSRKAASEMFRNKQLKDILKCFKHLKQIFYKGIIKFIRDINLGIHFFKTPPKENIFTSNFCSKKKKKKTAS